MTDAHGIFQVVETGLPGLKLLQPRIFTDARGRFVKTYHAEAFAAAGMDFVPREEFFSISGKGVLRGMHLQVPPVAHQKLVYCLQGRVLDVVLDVRSGSSTRGKTYSRELSGEQPELLFIPKGFAHGFLALENDALMVYQTDTVHAPECDAGVLWNSFGFQWQIGSPIMSDRDRSFPKLETFISPFQWEGGRS